MIAYASLTHTRRNLDALRQNGWRIMLSPQGCGLDARDFRYALDNGAWHSHQQNVPFDATKFLRAVERVGAHADFIVLPDIVGGGWNSLDLSLEYYVPLRGLCVPLLIPVQDGMDAQRFLAWTPTDTGIFVGGSTEWKLHSLPTWARCERYLHVGRVNTVRRIRLCADAGAQSFDGTSASRYAVTLPALEAARLYYGEQQRRLFNA